MIGGEGATQGFNIVMRQDIDQVYTLDKNFGLEDSSAILLTMFCGSACGSRRTQEKNLVVLCLSLR